MKISLENFRGFKRCGPVEIRPITLLVGENSSGKTSFQAALRYLLTLNSFSSQEFAGFNQPPFFLGGFEDIAYSRLGRTAVTSDHFTLELERQTPPDSYGLGFPTDKHVPPYYQIRLTFSEWLGQPVLKTVRLTAASKSATIDLRDATVKLTDHENGQSVPYKLASKMRPQLAQASRFPPTIAFVIAQLFPIAFKDSTPTYRVVIDSDVQAEVPSAFSPVFSVANRIFLGAREDIPVSALSPMRTEPKRVYEVLDTRTSPMGTHVPVRLAQQKILNVEEWNKQRAYFTKFGKDAGLFSNIDIRRLGSTQNDPFQIMVSVGGKKRNLMDVGYGVSQVLPLLYEMAEVRKKLLLIQQPEVHLHPRAQAELGSLIVETHAKRAHDFVIETHSDFIVDRICNHIRLGELQQSSVSLLYFHRNKNEISISPIALDDLGNVIDPPTEYRDFFYREEKNLLGF